MSFWTGKITHNWTVAETKTRKKGRFPHEQYGWTRSSIISSWSKNKCIQLGLDRTYRIHAFRNMLNSDMRMDNAPAKMCGSMFGNTPEVNN